MVLVLMEKIIKKVSKKKVVKKAVRKPRKKKVLDKATSKLLNEIKTITSTTTAELIRPIVPIDEWIDSEYYVGDLVYTLYPKYKQHIRSIFDPERDESDYIDEIILKSSIGTGKTSFINVVLLRKLYELSCYNDIRPLYNLMTSKKLLMVYFSITREVAENTGYAQLRNMLLSIPYFRENFEPNTKGNYDIKWNDRNMAITSGSKPNQVIGSDVIASVIDEGDFYNTSINKTDGQALSNAQVLYSTIRQRARSRFLVNGINHSLNCILSSPTYASGFITKLVEENRNNPHCYIIEETLWSIKPKGTYSDKMFLVFKGTNVLDPCIVDSVVFFNDLLATLYLPQQLFSSNDPVACLSELPPDVSQYFLEVPVDFYSDFKVNLIKALQDIGSVAVAPEGRLFTSEKYYQKAVKNISSPLMQEEITISTSVSDPRTIQSYFKPDYKPAHPELPRFLHFDQALTSDEAGVACSYVEVTANDDGTLNKKVTVEWMIRVVPPKKPEQIDLKKLRSICYYLRDTLNLQIGKITFDSFASEESIQDLKIHNFNVERLSLDKDDKAYTDIVQLYFTESIKHPNHKRYREELFNLIWYRAKHKVDHTPELDKGVTDAVVGSAYNAIIDADSLYSNLRSSDPLGILKFM